MSSKAPKICVAVRKRPCNPDVDKDVVNCNPRDLTVNEPRIKFDLTPYTERHNFVFDEVFDEKSNNRDVYVRSTQPLIDTVFSKGNATVFAYGQTGSGKSYTMLGKDESSPGIVLYAAHDVFQRAQQQNCVVFASFYEIYGRKLFDLLNDRAKLVCREDGNGVIQICGLTEHPVSKIEEMLRIVESGNALRAAGQTSANSESSRSHAVLTMDVREMKDQKPVGKMSIIDLAGNERGSDTFDSDRKTRIEGAEINKSLLALKECIRALGMGKSHVPFRGSILTEVLRDSFLGNSRTTMIATISATAANCEHTLNTLRYTSRVKELGPGGKPAANKQDAVTNPAQRYQTKEQGNKAAESKAVVSGGAAAANKNNPQFDARAAALAEKLASDASGANNKNPSQQASSKVPVNPTQTAQQQQSSATEQPKQGRRSGQESKIPTSNNTSNANNNNNNNVKRPGWNNDFVEGDSSSSNVVQNANKRPSLAAVAANKNNNNNLRNNNNSKTGALQQQQQQKEKLKDPVVQTIIQNHINQLDEIEAASDDDDVDDDDDEENNTDDEKIGKNVLGGSFRKARAVHAHIVSRIRQSEETVIAVHRKHIDSKMQQMKMEVTQLQQLDDNIGRIDEYVERVDSLLAKQMKEISDMRDRLAKIGTYLKEEEVLSKTLTPAGKKRQ